MHQGGNALRELDLEQGRRARVTRTGAIEAIEEHRVPDALLRIALRWPGSPVGAPSVELDLRFHPDHADEGSHVAVSLRWGARADGDPTPGLRLAYPPLRPWRALHLGELRGSRSARATTLGGAEIREEYLDDDARFALTLAWATDEDDAPTALIDVEHPPVALRRRPVALGELGEGWHAAATPLGGAEVVEAYGVPEARIGVRLRWSTDTEPEPVPEIELAPPLRKRWILLPLAFLARPRSAGPMGASGIPAAAIATVALVALVAAAAVGGLTGLREDPREVPLEASGLVEPPLLEEGAEAPGERGIATKVRDAVLGIFGQGDESASEAGIDLRFREERADGFLTRLNLAPGDVTVGQLNLTRAAGRAEELELSFRLDIKNFGVRRGERLDEALFVRRASYGDIDLLARAPFDPNGDGRVSFREFGVGEGGLPPPPRDTAIPFRVEVVFDPRTSDNGAHFRPQRLETTIYFDLEQVRA